MAESNGTESGKLYPTGTVAKVVCDVGLRASDYDID